MRASASSIIYLVILVFVLGHPEHVLRRREALERVTATVIGGFAGLVVLALFSIQPHLLVLLLLVLIAGLWFSHRIMTGPFSPVTYQFGFSVMVVLIVSGLTNQDPLALVFQRVVLTVGGAKKNTSNHAKVAGSSTRAQTFRRRFVRGEGSFPIRVN